MAMKAIYGCLMVLFLMAMPVFAQEQPPSADEIVSKMQSKLNLTQDQIAAITPIIEKYTSKREELRQGAEDGTLDKNDMHVQLKQLKVDEKQDLSQILSADQLSQWEKMMARGPHKRSRSWGASGGSDAPPPQQ